MIGTTNFRGSKPLQTMDVIHCGCVLSQILKKKHFKLEIDSRKSILLRLTKSFIKTCKVYSFACMLFLQPKWFQWIQNFFQKHSKKKEEESDFWTIYSLCFCKNLTTSISKIGCTTFGNLQWFLFSILKLCCLIDDSCFCCDSLGIG